MVGYVLLQLDQAAFHTVRMRHETSLPASIDMLEVATSTYVAPGLPASRSLAPPGTWFGGARDRLMLGPAVCGDLGVRTGF